MRARALAAPAALGASRFTIEKVFQNWWMTHMGGRVPVS